MIRLIFISFLLYYSLINGQNFAGIDSFLIHNINLKLTPNANLVFGYNSSIFYKKAFGKYTYNAEANSVDTNSIYDLASLTKVFSTTLCIMKLYDENKLNLDDKVIKYLPEFDNNEKGNITIKNLLLHNSGLPAYYSPKPGQSPDEIFKAIFNIKKAYYTGEKYLYSCLNFVTLMKVVEAITHKSMYEYYKENFIIPLQLKNTYFTPPDSIHYKIIPTTPKLQGQVHDPLAFGLKGLSGNAGLFSTTGDLAVICQMLLNKGTYNGITLFKEETVRLFTAQFDSTSSRALGWDTNGFLNSSAGNYLSKQAFGHTGYTGTSVWIDPVNNLFVVLLTNRVYPDDKVSLTEMRIKLHNYIIMNLKKIPPQPIIESVELINNKLNVNYNTQNKFVPIDNSYLIYSNNGSESAPILIPSTSNFYSLTIPKYNSVYPVKCKLYNQVANNKSSFSDEFAVLNKSPKTLIIDACILESDENNPYNTLSSEYFNNLPTNLGYTCISLNYATHLSINELNEFKNIIIYSAESSALSTFNDSLFVEKLLAFVTSGGNILISGSEYGWFLGRPEAGAYSNNLYSKLFNCKYLSDNAHTHIVIPNKSLLPTIDNLTFGSEKSIYKTRTPDVIKPFENSKPLFWYDNNNVAGNITELGIGKIIYLAFPLESIENTGLKKDLLKIIFTSIFTN